MSRFLKVMIVLLAITTFAAPAFAALSLSGFYRTQGTVYDDGVSDDARSMITTRARMKLANTINDNVTFVYYAETDGNWGGNYDIGVDDKNLETKNVYLDMKNDSYSFRVGAFGYGDTFDGLYFSDDAAGAMFKTNMGAVKATLIYSKLVEGDENIDDDLDFYTGQFSFMASDALTLGLSVHYGDAADGSAFVYGVNADFTVNENLSLSAFISAYNVDPDGGDSGGSYNANLAAKYAYNAGFVNFRVFYAPDEADAADRYFQVSESAFGGNQLFLLGSEAYATNNGVAAYGEDQGWNEALTNGDGLLALIVNGHHNFNDSVYGEYAIGYMDTDDDPIGTEVNVKVGTKVFEVVDLSLKAGALFADDYFTNDDTQTKVIGMMTVNF